MQQALRDKSGQELRRRREELQFLGNQYGMAGAGVPAELTEEFEAIQRELARRRALEQDSDGASSSD